MSPLYQRLRRGWRFLAEDVWDVELTSLPSLPRLGVKGVRVLQLVFKGFFDDECPLHASALTFNSLMAIVPILALSLALVRGLGGEETARSRIRSAVEDWTRGFTSMAVATNLTGAITNPVAEGQSDASPAQAADSKAFALEFAAQATALVDQAFTKMENVNFAAMGGVGLMLLLLMVVQVLGQVESSFNRVWGIAAGRPLWRKFTDYLSVLLILPVLILAASSLPIAHFLSRVLNESVPEQVSTWLTSGSVRDATVVALTSLAFTFVIMFMPNTRVRMGAGVAGGIVTALLFLGWIWLCKTLQIWVAGFSKIYGSFAVVPILLAWVYVSWEIVLLGAEVAFGLQNVATYRMERGAREASVRARVMLALSVVMEAARSMMEQGQGFEVADYACRRRVSVRFLNDIVEHLVHAGLLAEISEKSGRFVLLRTPAAVRVRDVFDSVILSGVQPESLGLRGFDAGVVRSVDGLFEGRDGSCGQTTIQDLLAGEDEAIPGS